MLSMFNDVAFVVKMDDFYKMDEEAANKLDFGNFYGFKELIFKDQEVIRKIVMDDLNRPCILIKINNINWSLENNKIAKFIDDYIKNLNEHQFIRVSNYELKNSETEISESGHINVIMTKTSICYADEEMSEI